MYSLSYWEQQSWFANLDFVIIGSGIVGLSTAIHLKQKHPNSKVLILERGVLPQGASTKNAGFACFGSASELLSDLTILTDAELLSLVEKRYSGLLLLEKMVGNLALRKENHGGFEVFLDSNQSLYENCIANLDRLNNLLKPVFKEPVFSLQKNDFGFQHVFDTLIKNNFEAQIDTGSMMQALLGLANSLGVLLLNNQEVQYFEDAHNKVVLKTQDFEIETKKLFITTNGFASKWIGDEVKPARAQVLVTKPIENLQIKGTFHLDEGYYYFRNIDNRILFGGGRNLDFEGETTTDLSVTKKIQNSLDEYLKNVILPNTPFEVDQRWSGIMGVGQQKKPIIKALSENVFCGVRMGGMGVAIGSLVGKELAEFIQ
jgi:gamma-glutamylputrescine oxidase